MPVAKKQSTCFEKLIFEHVFNVRKTKRIAKFDTLELRRYEHIKASVELEISPKSFRTGVAVTVRMRKIILTGPLRERWTAVSALFDLISLA